MKETFYFPHDYHARNDLKLQLLTMEQVGVYWCLVEMLYEEEGYIDLSLCERIATVLRVKCDIVKSVINDTNLFENDTKKFWSNSVLRRLYERREKSEKARESANKRWNKNANALRTQSEGNAIKESKVKEKKDTVCVSPVEEMNQFLNDEDFRKKVEDEFVGKGIERSLVQSKIRKFISYWTERNKSGTKQRWEMEKTFEYKRRLARFFMNK